MNTNFFKQQGLDVERLSKEEILDSLEAEAYEVETGEYFKAFSEDEAVANETKLIDKVKEVDILENEKARLIAPINEKLKPAKQIEKELRKKVTEGGHMVHGKIFLMIDRENRQMIKVNEDGYIIGTRALTPQERQLMINERQIKLGS